MDKNKVKNLVKSFSLSCKQAVKDKELMYKLTSPAVTLLALTLIQIVTLDAGKTRWWE